MKNVLYPRAQILVLIIPYSLKLPINSHADMSSQARGVTFVLSTSVLCVFPWEIFLLFCRLLIFFFKINFFVEFFKEYDQSVKF